MMEAKEAYKIASDKFPLDFTSCFEVGNLYVFSSGGLNASYSVNKETGESKAFMPMRDCNLQEFITKKPVTDFR